jgi:hypothetical protein
MRVASFMKQMIAVASGVLAAANISAHQAIAAESGSPNTLAYYDPGLLKATNAYGPLFSQYIPRSWKNSKSRMGAMFESW